MPLYRTGLDMYKKYQVKFNPTVISTRFTDVQALALDRAQAGLNAIGTVRDLIRPILDNYAVTGGLRATYLAFGTKLYRHILHQSGDSAKTIATALKTYFVNAYGLNADICDEIINVVCGWALAY